MYNSSLLYEAQKKRQHFLKSFKKDVSITNEEIGPASNLTNDAGAGDAGETMGGQGIDKALSQEKAKEILRDGTAHGKELTEKQRNYMGAVAGGNNYKKGLLIKGRFRMLKGCGGKVKKDVSAEV